MRCVRQSCSPGHVANLLPGTRVSALSYCSLRSAASALRIAEPPGCHGSPQSAALPAGLICPSARGQGAQAPHSRTHDPEVAGSDPVPALNGQPRTLSPLGLGIVAFWMGRNGVGACLGLLGHGGPAVGASHTRENRLTDNLLDMRVDVSRESCNSAGIHRSPSHSVGSGHHTTPRRQDHHRSRTTPSFFMR